MAIGRASRSCRLTTRVAPSGVIPAIRCRVCPTIRAVASSRSARSLTARASRPRRRPAAASRTPACGELGGLRLGPAQRPAGVDQQPLRRRRAAAWARSASSPVIRCTLSLTWSRPSWPRDRSFAAIAVRPLARPRGTGPAASSGPHRRRRGSVARSCRSGGSPWPADRSPSGTTRSPGPPWCPREPGWCATPSPRPPWPTTPRSARSTAVLPHRVVSFINVVGCGTAPSNGIRQNRRQVIESLTSRHNDS